MTICELRIDYEGTAASAPVAHLSIDGDEYMLVGTRTSHPSVTVIAGRWIKDRRALGKTFWNVFDLVAHYKKHGKALAEYAARLAKWQ